MRAVEYSGWASDLEEYSKMINCVKDQIHSVTKKLDTPDIKDYIKKYRRYRQNDGISCFLTHFW